MANLGKITFFSGKMGAGKSTLSVELATQNNAVLISEDEWLSSVYPDEISSLEDYVKYSNLLKPQMKKLVQSILLTGSSVVMDYPANTLRLRKWLKSIFTEIDADHELVYLDVPDEVCLSRIAKRSVEQPHRAKTDTPAMFEAMKQYFQAPTADEGFSVTYIAIDSLDKKEHIVSK